MKLEVHVEPSGTILLTIAGRITNDKEAEVIEWANKVKQEIELAFERTGTVRIYVDVAQVNYFERKPVAAVRELLDFDKKYPLRTAIVGANKMTSMLIDALLSLTRRTNIEQFQSKEEALLWLSA